MISPIRPRNTILAALPVMAIASAQYTATYYVGSLPGSSEEGQSGTNACGTSSSQSSECQNVYVNSVSDFCLWGPPATTSDEGDGTSKIGNVEQVVVSYCLNDGYGTRIIPAGTITGAHFIKVQSEKVSYVQVNGVGDLTSLLIPAGDDGGELDPHSWTGLGNPQGGLVFTNALTGSYEQTHEWTSFIDAGSFCIRACQDGPNAAGYCQHIYDTLSCDFTVPGDSSAGSFTDCLSDPTDEEPGVYDGSTFYQGASSTPAPHPAGATSACTTYSTIGGGSVNLAASPSSSSSSSTSSSSTSSVITTSSSNSASSTSAASSNSSSASAAASSTSASVSSTTSVSASSTTSSLSVSRTPSPSASRSASASVSIGAAAASQSTGAGSKTAMGGVSVFTAILLSGLGLLF
ncbi:hypothetical protein BCR39DRAFT_528410 [Naematelia encephala]|uniref:Macrofage activating glycoprotein n=1 Tax=Naematelia encephala TaxID=71784 RepID=A0A1Y2B8E8_9TREE|nr:hypothetical protein BCR39DRAFT_528410 [Naematelia encephala]